MSAPPFLRPQVERLLLVVAKLQHEIYELNKRMAMKDDKMRMTQRLLQVSSLRL
jgi:hypothetical protein